MYYRTGYYESAAIAFENLIKEFPRSMYTEEALYLMVQNSYLYAKKSVMSKQVERYQSVLDHKNKLKAYDAQSKYLMEAEKLAADAKVKRNKILTENKK
jgi:outer membrane protein assembly factor BamD